MDQYDDNQYRKLSSGCNYKYEQSAEKCYSPNYFTKTLQYVDPRQRYRLLDNSYCSNESIALQRNETSPLSMVKITPQKRYLTPQLMPRRCTIQETSLTQNVDTEIMVQKIQNMFPTAGANHIRLLLKKYYNREAVVISALQVEKYPVTMPGPYVTPPSKRNVYHNTPSSTSSSLIGCRYMAFGSSHEPDLISMSYNNSRSTSPAQYYGITYNERKTTPYHDFNPPALISATQQAISKYPVENVRNKAKVHTSPKMKLRYMKAIFPQAEETLIFDVLANADNNVQIATDKLIAQGYIKHDPLCGKNEEAKKQHQTEIQNAQEKTFNLNKMHSREERDFLKKKLSEKYPCIAERIVLMALESVNYDEERAIKILQIVQEEETERQLTHSIKSPMEQSNDQKIKSNEFNKCDNDMKSQDATTVTVLPPKECKPEVNCKQNHIKQRSLAKGPNESLLLADYVIWNGANPDYHQGQKCMAAGPNAALRTKRTYMPCGHNPKLCNGPQSNLVRGSAIN